MTKPKFCLQKIETKGDLYIDICSTVGGAAI